MKLPIVHKAARNKRCRDAYILKLYYDDGLGAEKIRELLPDVEKISTRRILGICALNAPHIVLNERVEKLRRIRRLKQEIASKPKSKKDVIDIMAELRKELEGDNNILIDQSRHIHWTVNIKQYEDNEVLEHADRLQIT